MLKLFIVVNIDRFFLTHRKSIGIAAKKLGYDVTIVTHFTGFQNTIKDLDLKVLDLPVNPTGTNIIDELQTYFFLKKLYKKEKPDIIHHVGLKIILWGTLAAKEAKIKNVINAVAGTGFLFSPDRIDSITSKSVCKMLQLNSRPNYKYIFQNHDDEKEFINAGIISNSQSVFIKGSGVDLDKFEYVGEELKDSSIIKLVFTGRMIEDKGIFILAAAANILKSKYNNKIEFLLCGDIDKNPKALSQEDLLKICDGNYIKWLGFQKDIYSVLKQCHIMVFPSFYMEGLPKSIIDAEAAGLPIITTDWVGCKDTVIDGYNGFLVPPKNSDALAEKIAILVENEELRRQMGKNARDYAKKYFSLDEVVAKHLEVYKSFFNK